MRKFLGALVALGTLAGWLIMVQPTRGVQPTMVTPPPVVPWYPTTTTSQFPPWDTSNVPYGDRGRG